MKLIIFVALLASNSVVGHVLEWKLKASAYIKPHYSPQEKLDFRRAIYQDNLKAIKKLVKFKTFKNEYIGDFCHMTALHLAIIHKKFKIFKYFLKKIGDPNPALDERCGEITGVHIAVKENAWDILLHYMKILPKRHKNPRDLNGNTPIHLGTRLGRIDMVKYLSRQVENFNVKNNFGEVPLHLAARFQRLELVKFFAASSPRVNYTSLTLDTPIHEAARVGNLEIVKFLHTRDKQLMYVNIWCDTPLHYAAEVSLPIVKFILKHVPDPKEAIQIRNNRNLTALDVACKAEQLEICQFLENT